MLNRNQVICSILISFALLVLLAYPVSSQQFTTQINGWNAYVSLPDDYSGNTKRYPVIIFLPGIGEVGNNVSKLLSHGPSRFINMGNKMEFVVNGVLEKPIVISLQPPRSWPSPPQINTQIDSILRRWRVDPNRISATGLSMGGSVWENYITASPTYAKRLVSMVIMSAPPPSYPLANFAVFAANGGRWWGFEGTADNRFMWRIRDFLNNAVDNSARYTKYTGGHCCWNNWYDPKWRENDENVYEWMLKTQSSAPPDNKPPVANAGPDRTITLPTNSVLLAGSGSDPDGTIASYSWTKISGPSQFNIQSPASAQTNIQNLVAGTYQFRLQVTDDRGATHADTVRVTVNPAPAPPPPPNQPPVANAGPDRTITLPTNSVLLAGSGSDPDGTIASYSWTKISGPSQFNIQSPASAQTNVQNLVAGTYQFRLQVTDDRGATHADTVRVTVNPASAPPPPPPPPPNQPPVANAGPDRTITLPTNSVLLAGSGSDPDGTIAAYTWTKISGPSQFNIQSPASAQTNVQNLVAGTYQFRLQVTDDRGATHADTVRVTVNPAPAPPPPPNQPPVANAGPDRTITLPTNSVLLAGSGSDPDGTIAAYSWTKISGPSQFNIQSPVSAQTNVQNLVAGTYQFRLQVTDDRGATHADTVRVTVNPAPAPPPPPPPNQPPLANAGGDRSITLPEELILAGYGIDPDGVIVSYHWLFLSGPSQPIIFNENNIRSAVSNIVPGTYRFVLRVVDNDGASATDTLNITVNKAPNRLPTVRAWTEHNINTIPEPLMLSGEAEDVDGFIESFRWRQILGPGNAGFLTPDSSSTYLFDLQAGAYKFELTAIDNEAGMAKDTVSLIVKNPLNTNVELYPNPAKTGDHVTIKVVTRSYSGVLPISIFDMNNQLVYSRYFTRNQVVFSTRLNLDHLRPGVYIVQIWDDEGKMITRKWIKLQ